MEKVQLFFNEVDFNHSMRQLASAKSDCQRMIDQINEIGAFKMDQAALIDVLQGKGEASAKRVEKATEAELDKVGIKSATIRKAAVSGDLEKYYAVFKSFVRPSNVLWPYLSVNSEGAVIVSAEAEAILREEYTVYIKTEAGLACYAAHKKMVKAINDFFAAAPQLRPESIIQCLGEGETQRTVGLPTGARLLGYDRISNSQWT